MSRFGVPRIKKKDPDILEQVQFTTTTTAGAAGAHEPCLLSSKHKAGSGDIVPLSAATKWEDVEKGEPHPSQAAIMTAREATDLGWNTGKSLQIQEKTHILLQVWPKSGTVCPKRL